MKEKRVLALEAILSNPAPDEGHKQAVQELLALDELNFTYYLTLLGQHKYSRDSGQKEKWRLCGRGEEKKTHEVDPEVLLVFPSAVAPAILLAELPVVHYDQLVVRIAKKNNVRALASKCVLWFWPMQAGIGTTVERSSYLQSWQGGGKETSLLGSKGTDLRLKIHHQGKDHWISLAEVQILRTMKMAENGPFRKIIISDLVGPETERAVQSIWERPCLIDPSRTYDQIFSERTEVGRFGKTFQANIPNLIADNRLSVERKSPAGHGLFAVDALRKSFMEEKLPVAEGDSLLGVIGNGEDLGCFPDEAMVEWMLENNIPIAMVTTEKTEIDLKGGQISLVEDKTLGTTYIKIVEQAEAAELGQLSFFQEVGLRKDDGPAFFNTNMALINYGVLGPMLKKLQEELGPNAMMELIAPGLIENWKEGKRFLQLEGAMGSVLLNLDREWRKRFRKPLVHIINIPKILRTRFFSPIKTSFDYFMLFHSDRFSIDRETLSIVNHRPGHLPTVELKDAYYREVQHVLACFAGTGILHLDSLSVQGRVNLQGALLEGKVVITSLADDLVELGSLPFLKELIKEGRLVLKNVEIEIDASSGGTIKWI